MNNEIPGMSQTNQLSQMETLPPIYRDTEESNDKKKKKKRKKSIPESFTNPNYQKESSFNIVSHSSPTEETPVIPRATVSPISNVKFPVSYPADVKKFVCQLRGRECKAYKTNDRISFLTENDPKEGDYCRCNRLKTWHEESNLPELGPNEKWQAKVHTKLIQCNAHGKIKLHGYGKTTTGVKPKYIRIDSMMKDFEMLWTLMTKYWDMPTPNLILSMNGGAKKMKPMTHRLKTALKRGIFNVSSCTNTWVITGGFQFGISKLVGDATKSGFGLSAGKNRLAVIGIATWGAVYNRSQLINELPLKNIEDDGLPVVDYYNCTGELGKGLAPLDPNHTHFLLCDDGTERAFGAEIDFRAEFENFIGQKMRSLHAASASPVVQIVIEGGKKAIETAYKALKEKTPVVIIEGSGRAADVMCHVVSTISPDTDLETAYQIINPHLEKYKKEWSLSEDDFKNAQKYLLQIAKELRTMVHIFNIDGVTKDLDKAILIAVFKSSHDVTTQMQLELAMNMNRCDLAQQEIFIEDKTKWKEINIEKSFVDAVNRNLVDFVELFLDHGLSMEAFLTRDRLTDFYNYLYDRQNGVKDRGVELFRDLLDSQKPYHWLPGNCCKNSSTEDDRNKVLELVGDLINKLTKGAIANPYKYPESKQETDKGSTTVLHEPGRRESGPNIVLTPATGEEEDTEIGKCRHAQLYPSYPPYSADGKRLYSEHDLFYWALLTNRFELAKKFWRLGKDQIGAALVAVGIIKKIQALAQHKGELELASELEQQAIEFERMAVGILKIAYEHDKILAHLILVRPLPYYGNHTCLSCANQYNCEEFLFQPACQTKLNSIWMGGMSQTVSNFKILLNLFFAVFFIRLIFPSRSEYENKVAPNPAEEMHVLYPGHVDVNAPNAREEREYVSAKIHARHMSSRKADSFLEDYRLRQSRGFMDVSYFKALRLFYKAPVIKFLLNLISNIAFLCLLSYVCLITLKTKGPGQPTVIEYIVWAWFLTFVIEEFRQALISDTVAVKFRVIQWFSNAWNLFDVVLYLFYIIAVLMRMLLPAAYFFWARNFHCITLSMFFIRFMQFYYAHKFIGPKVVMIRRMLNDVFFFLMIYVLFVLAYGTLAQGMRYPNPTPSWVVLKNVFYDPYWQTYGELNLESVEGDYNCPIGDNSCVNHSPLAIIAFVFFMLFTNVLLLNLLIAMFGYTFQKVQDSSEKVWAFNRFELIYEFFDRPNLPPPLLIIPLIVRMFVYIHHKCCTTCRTCLPKRHRKDETDFTVYLNVHENLQMSSYVQQCMDGFMLHSWEQQDHQGEYESSSSASAENKLKESLERMTGVIDKLSSIQQSFELNKIKNEGNLRMSMPPLSSPSKDLSRQQIVSLTERMDSMENRIGDIYEEIRSLVSTLKNSQPHS